MIQKCVVATTILSIFVLYSPFSSAAPAFKFKKSFAAYNTDRYPTRVDRRLSGGSSPIHYITPFMGIPPSSMNTFSNFFAPPSFLGNPSSSSVYKLPLRLLANGKPHAVYQSFNKAQNVMDYFPQAMSNIIRLPLKYISNAKPYGVYFKDPSFNYL